MDKASRAAEVEALITEIQRYLAYVKAFGTRPPAPPPAEHEGGNGNV
jgi:hypothetical protein